MISTKDHEELFSLIANYLEKDIRCVSIGGTAMMFLGYKTATKDIDLVFGSAKDRSIFVQAIEQLGYARRALSGVYDERMRKQRDAPEMYSRGDERFDLFVKSVFGYSIDPKEVVERRDYIGRNELTVLVLPKEELVLLKAITRRERDYEDILDILKIEKSLDWERIISNAIKHKNRNRWMLIDLEECLQKLKEVTFIPEKHFKMIYQAQKD